MSRGVYYITTGEEYTREACLSAKQVKAVMDVPIAIATDQDVDAPYFDYVIDASDGRNDFGIQIQNLERTPFDETICLDSDIYVYSDISDVFDLLGHFDLAAPFVPHWGVRDVSDRTIPEAFPEYNTGVVAYRDSPAFGEFMDRWREEYERTLEQGLTENQLSFRRAAYRSDVRIATLPDRYHARIERVGLISNHEAKVFHGRLLDFEAQGIGINTSMEEAVEKLNGYNKTRAFINNGRLRVYPTGPEQPLLQMIDGALHRGGVRYLLRRSVEVGGARLLNSILARR